MASPTLETLCCIFDLESNSTKLPLPVHLNFSKHELPYNILSIVSSVVGAIGAICQLCQRSSLQLPCLRAENLAGSRQAKIITWLAFSDLLAAIGIFVRAVLWLSYKNHDMGHHTEQLMCAITSGWIQYFYTVTYFWTFCYAIEVYCSLKQIGSFSLNCYHLFTWLTPAVLCVVGLGILYHPQLRCYYNMAHLLPNYLCVLIPLLLVMVINPVLYAKTASHASDTLALSAGMCSYRERKLTTVLRDRFFSIVLVFYVCWLPNIVNGIAIWTLWRHLQTNKIYIFSIWYTMALLNPLQAAFNLFVYNKRDVPLRFFDLKDTLAEWLPQLYRSKSGMVDSTQIDEQTPLLTNVRSGPRNVPEEMSINGQFFNF